MSCIEEHRSASESTFAAIPRVSSERTGTNFSLHRLCTYERRVRNLMLLVEEAYTLGMLLDEAEVPGDVVATDIHSTALPHKTLAFARPLRCIS